MSAAQEAVFWSSTRQQGALSENSFTSAELTKAYLERIERYDGTLIAFVELDAEGALAAAEQADKDRAAGKRSAVLGLPFGVKDLIDVADMNTTYGSVAFKANLASQDAPAIARLREAGGVILGKLNTTEFALFNENTIAGSSMNPWDLGRTAGGSSNGSATAVSAGLCSFSIGTDTAGSIRTPSSFCGLFGLKPTHGRVPAAGIGEISTSMDTIGVLARSAEDVSGVLQILAGYEPNDMTSAWMDVPTYPATAPAADTLSIGAPAYWVSPDIHPEVTELWRKLLNTLETAGAEVGEVEMPDVSETMMLFRGLAAGDLKIWHDRASDEQKEQYSDHAKAVVGSTEGVTAAEVSTAFKKRFEWRRSFEALLEDRDALILPVTPVPAPTLEEIEDAELKVGDDTIPGALLVDFCMPMNITGLPALTVPIGLSKDGLPIAVQIVAAPFDEESLLKVALAVSAAMPFGQTPPDYS